MNIGSSDHAIMCMTYVAMISNAQHINLAMQVKEVAFHKLAKLEL